MVGVWFSRKEKSKKSRDRERERRGLKMGKGMVVVMRDETGDGKAFPTALYVWHCCYSLSLIDTPMPYALDYSTHTHIQIHTADCSFYYPLLFLLTHTHTCTASFGLWYAMLCKAVA